MAEAMINIRYSQAPLSVLQMQQSQSSEARQDTSGTSPRHQTQFHSAMNRKFSKVVGFDVPAKRQRPNTEITAQNVTLAIQHGITETDRKEAICNACAAFDHGIAAAHDDEIKVGADTALFKHLTFLLLKRSSIAREEQHQREKDENLPGKHTNDQGRTNNEMDSIMEEIKSTLQGLEMVLRCSAECISVCFTRIGKEILPIILSLLQEQRSQRLDHRHSRSHGELKHTSSFQSTSTVSSTHSNMLLDNNASAEHQIPRQTGDAIFKTATKMIGHFARVGSLTDTLATTRNLLTTLKQIIAMPVAAAAPIEAKLNCLWIIANLACSAENMILMASHPGLIDTLVKVASHPTADDESNCGGVMDYIKLLRKRSIAVRAILNLSWAHENKIPLTEHSDLVEVLLKTATHRQSSWTGDGKGVSGILMQSRRHAAGALRNLAAAPRRYKRRLCRLRNGCFLETLADMAENDPDAVVRDKVHATLYNLISADTAKQFIEKKSVLDVIVKAATSNEVGPGKESDCPNSRTMAVQTLRSLEKAIPEDEQDYDALRPVLSRFDSQVQMSKSHSTLGMNKSPDAAAV